MIEVTINLNFYDICLPYLIQSFVPDTIFFTDDSVLTIKWAHSVCKMLMQLWCNVRPAL